MTIQDRKNCLLLLLILMVSHAALTLHASSHVANEQQNCQICSHYSNLNHAIPPAVASSLLPDRYAADTVPEITCVSVAATTHYRQRAPPYLA